LEKLKADHSKLRDDHESLLKDALKQKLKRKALWKEVRWIKNPNLGESRISDFMQKTKKGI